MYDSPEAQQILGLEAPWKATGQQLSHWPPRIDIDIRREGKMAPCPRCGQVCPIHDTVKRTLRDLDNRGYRVYLHVRVPRTRCPDCGTKQIDFPLARSKAQNTMALEDEVIRHLAVASINTVAREHGLSWHAVANIMDAAVVRGLAFREEQCPEHICVDEVSFRKRHRYVTVVSCRKTGRVLFVTEGRDAEALMRFYNALSTAQRAAIKTVSMDMSRAYISATRKAFRRADSMICFDRFHVQKALGDAVDKVRKGENRTMMIQGDRTLVGKRYQVLRQRANLNWHDRRELTELVSQAKKTGRAWAILEASRRLWNYVSMTWARKGWMRLIGWMQRSRLEPMREAARTLKAHLHGILNAVIHRASNAMAESNNAKIKAIKVQAKGFHSVESFQRAILFRLGGLKLQTGYLHPYQHPASA